MSIAPPKDVLNPGYRLDRYELLCPIAEGGMASVWVARLKGKHGFEKLVAIKTILPKYASDSRFQQMFLDEARIASGIEHTNVAEILDLGEEHDVLYLVMEWVDGDSLSKLMRTVDKKGEKIPTGIVCRILADVCGGLHAAHELRGSDGKHLNVVHRDVSPQNILVSTKGVAKLIDFGIAKAKDRMSGETSAGLLKGKVQYMAPEQALGQAVDARADIWAIGAILYHVFAGRPAYDGDNQLAQLHQLTSGKPPLPLPANVPKPVADVIKKALSFNPSARFASAAEMQRALEKAMVEAEISSSPADVSNFARTHMAERAEARRKSVELALKAATQRTRMNEMLRAPVGDETLTPTGEGSQAGVAPAAPGRVGSSLDVEAAVAPRAHREDGARAERPSVPSQTSSTLATAGVMTPSPDGPIELPRRKRALGYVVGVGVGVAVIIGLAALSVGKTPSAGPPRDTRAAISPPAEPPVPPTPTSTAEPAKGDTSGSAAPTATTRPPAVKPAIAVASPPPRSVTAPPRAPPSPPTSKPPATTKPPIKPTPDDGF